MIRVGVAKGGATLTAYNYLQYTHITQEERLLYNDALLRYCELDTMAMVFILEGLKNLEDHPWQLTVKQISS